MKSIIRNFLAKLMAGRSDDGIMITLKDPQKVTLAENIMMDTLMRNGIDPASIKNETQLKNILEQIKIVNERKMRDLDVSGIRNTESAKLFEITTGKEIPKGSKIMGGKAVDDMPPPGSRGGKDDIAAPVQSSEESLKNMIEAENKKNIAKMKERKMQRESLEDFVDDAGGVDPDDPRAIDDFIPDDDPEPLAKGGIARIGYKKGSVDLARRGFMKAAAGFGAGLGALKMGALKLFGKEGTRQVTKQIIKTDNVPGKPEWFDALVTKVINEGEDMTKQFATKEREIVHATKIGKDDYVRVTQDLDDGTVRVEYESPDNVYGDQVVLEYKKPLPDEGDPRPVAEFTTAESGPVGRAYGPDDYELNVEEISGRSISDLDSDLSKLKIFATGKKPTLKEFVQNKKRKDKAARITDDIDGAASDAVIRRQGDFDPSDYEDFAKGGIARMLGE